MTLGYLNKKRVDIFDFDQYEKYYEDEHNVSNYHVLSSLYRMLTMRVTS